MLRTLGRAVAALAAAALLVPAVSAPALARPVLQRGRPSAPTVAQIGQALQHDPVYVAPDATLHLSSSQLRLLHADLRATADPTYVVVLHRLPAGQPTTREVGGAVVRHVEPNAWVIVYSDVSLPTFGGAFTMDSHADTYVYAQGAAEDQSGPPAQRLLDFTGKLSGRLADPTPFSSPLSDSGSDGGPGLRRAPATTSVHVARYAVLGVLALLVLGLVVAALRLVGRAGTSGWRARRLTAGVDRGRLADRTIAARRDVLDLGTRLDATELRPGDDTVRWQAALDAYDRAGRALDRAATVDDFERVVALCQEGSRDLDQALRSRA